MIITIIEMVVGQQAFRSSSRKLASRKSSQSNYMEFTTVKWHKDDAAGVSVKPGLGESVYFWSSFL